MVCQGHQRHQKHQGRRLFCGSGKDQKSPSVIPIEIESNEAPEISADNDLPEDVVESSIEPSLESPDLESPDLEVADFTALEVAEIPGEEADWDPLAMEEIEIEEVLEDLPTDSGSLNPEQPTTNSQEEETSKETTEITIENSSEADPSLEISSEETELIDPIAESEIEETTIDPVAESELEEEAIVAEVDDTDADTESEETTDEETEDEDAEDTLIDIPLLLSDVVGGLGTVTDPSGQLSVTWKFDGGAYEGQVGVVSTAGLENYDLNSIEFMQEAIRRALDNIVVDDTTKGAEFGGWMNGEDSNHGEFAGVQTVQLSVGEQFFLALIPNGTFADILYSLEKGHIPTGDTRPLFSLATANPKDMEHFVQLVDLTGKGSLFALEDIRGDEKSDWDLNDIIITLKGAEVDAAQLDDLIETGVITEAPKWMETDLGITILESAIDDLWIEPEDLVTEKYEFPKEDQPLIGFIDTHLTTGNPDINYSNISFGKDWIENDSNPTVVAGEGTHADHILGIVAATQDNGLGIDGINDDAPLWVSSAVESGKWADALVEFVDAAIASNQPNAIINLSIDLTQVNPDGSVTTRYEFTPQERAAIEYARQSGVLIVAAAGNDGGVMSVLGQASQEFDNIITVGAADGMARAAYSSYGYGLDIVAPGGSIDNPILSNSGDGLGTMAGTSVATAQVTGAASQVWAANPELNYRQVIEILKETATDLNTPGWDEETGAGLLNITAAVGLAKIVTPINYEIPAIILPEIWTDFVAPRERAARVPYTFKSGDTLWGIAQAQLGNGTRWVEIQKENGSTYTSQEATSISIGTVIYLPGNSPAPIPTPPIIPSPSVGSLVGKKIALDPGHGNSTGRFDPGAVGNGTTEAVENMVQAQIIANYLRQRGAEVKIIDDGNLELEQIGQQSSGSDLFVSLHLNSASVRAQGHEVYSHSSAPAIDGTLARVINNELDAVFPDSEIPNRGVKTANFGVLRGAPTSVPAVLVESLFINSPGMSRANVEKAAEAIARGIEKFLTGNVSNVGTGNNGDSGSSAPPATPGEQRKYQVRLNDTLSGIALTQLGNANRWREIMKTPSGGTFTEAEAKNIIPGQYVYLPVIKQIGTGLPVNIAPISAPVANQVKPGYVNSNVGSIPLNMRATASTGAAILRTLPKDTGVTILRSVTGSTYSTPQGNRSDWYEIQVGNQRGYVAAYYVTEGTIQPKSEPGYVNSNVGSIPLNMRATASTSATITGRLPINTNLTILKSVTGSTYPTPQGNRSDWYEVEVNGQRGFVAAYYVTKGTNSGGGGDNSQTWQNPLPGYPVTSGYGLRSDPATGKQTMHWGIDFGTSGKTPPVKAAKGGRVVHAGWDPSPGVIKGASGPSGGYGNLVMIDHPDGTRTYYAHLSSISVTKGQEVTNTTTIGNVGSTGYSTGNHLHFEVRVSPYRWQTDNRNPLNYIKL